MEGLLPVCPGGRVGGRPGAGGRCPALALEVGPATGCESQHCT